MANSRSSTVLADQLGTLYGLGTVGALPDDQLVERFLARNDPATSEAAFRALVDRHGSMVFGVCQRILRNPHDANDAFQATFLILMQNAAAIRRRESVAAWLFGIARRVAARARQKAARRRRRIENLHVFSIVPGHQSIDTNAGAFEPDYSPLLAEIDKLPEPLRTPVVLHYFEGQSTEAVALRLGCPRGTILSRLSRARERLRSRLKDRGGLFEAAMPASGAASPLSSNATVPATLVQSTIRAASSLALAGTVIESVVPATVATLSRGIVHNLLFAKVRPASVLVILGMATAALGLWLAAPGDEMPRTNDSQAKTVFEQATAPASAAQSKTTGQRIDESVVVRSQVLDPNGKPIAGARIVLTTSKALRVATCKDLTISGKDGRFEASLPGDLLDAPDSPFFPVIGAWSHGLGPDWVMVNSRTVTKEVILRLRRDDIPIEGRISGLEGQPVVGATVSITCIERRSGERALAPKNP